MPNKSKTSRSYQLADGKRVVMENSKHASYKKKENSKRILYKIEYILYDKKNREIFCGKSDDTISINNNALIL